VNPTTETRWRNQFDTFSWAARGTTDALYQAFDRTWRKLRWKKIPGFNAQAGSPSTNFEKVKIVTNSEGINGYIQLNRSANDRLRNDPRRNNDPGFQAYGDDPTFNNIEITDLEVLDPGGSAAMTVGQPDFYWLNMEYLFPVYHGETYMQEVGPIQGSVNQPFSYAVYKNTYYNLMCRSRKRQAKIFTAA
jgi:hypothetical protein